MSKQNNEMVDLSGVSFPSSVEYTLLEELGRGGMGIVFLSERDACGVVDLVVLKTVISLSESYLEDLKKEANIATGLRHENIVKTYGLESIPLHTLPKRIQKDLKGLEKGFASSAREFGRRRLKRYLKNRGARVSSNSTSNDHQKIHLICMDYVDGMDLSTFHYKHVKQNLILPVPISAFIISRMCRALEYAHQHIVHRDISPENILINGHGVCKLTDFGVAVESDEPVNLLAGKFSYMAPEQIEQDQVDGRSDIFSLGVVFYQLLTGIQLFNVPSNIDMSKKVDYVRSMHNSSIPAPKEVRPDVPETLSKIVMKMIKRDPDDRFHRASEVGTILEQKYLYEKGFGPTNNSLKSYMEIFNSGFDDYNDDQLMQLRFLESDGKFALRRTFREGDYTDTGIRLLEHRDLHPA